MPAALQRASDILPLTYGIKLLKVASLGLPVDHMAFPVILMIVIVGICIILSVRFFSMGIKMQKSRYENRIK